MRLAYLFSRYPVVSQTFCDTEILALEKMGVDLELYSIYPPPTSFRHGHAVRIKAEIRYAPPSTILKLGEEAAKLRERWPTELIATHDRRYGKEYKAALRARNALYFADLFRRRGLTHFHVHFANRAAHTAIFIKAFSGIPFSISTHGQDFMSDLGNDDLLREICREAEFVANETEFSKGLVRARCPDAESKMLRVFNGMDLALFPGTLAGFTNAVPRILSIGRLIEFKGFHLLVAACRELARRGLVFECEIIGEGPWRSQLETQIASANLGERVRLLGAVPQEDTLKKLRESDIFALPCIVDRNGASDVFPTVILEAMASTKAVVSTRLAGIPEQIEDGQTGFLVKSGDEDALAGALERLITSAELRHRLGRAARERVEKEFAVERTVLPLKAAFEETVRTTTPPPRSPAGFACLLHEWPCGERQDTELRQLREIHPEARIYVTHATSSSNIRSALNPSVDFDILPDAMVLEGEWQQERERARLIETWRVELGQKLSSELFLQTARYALFLRRWIERDKVQHVHALSSRELLCAWMLRKLCAVSFSLGLEEKSPHLPESLILVLARSSVGVRIAGTGVTAENLRTSSTEPIPTIVNHKHGRALEKEWVALLRGWGGLSL